MTDEIIYIFLDVDGVLNNDKARKAYRGNDMRILSEDNLLELSNLINSINHECRIVLISTWRYSHDNVNVLNRALKKYQLSLFNCLDINHSKSKSELIIKYCKQKNITFSNIIIIDDGLIDDGLIDDLSNHLVKCDFRLG